MRCPASRVLPDLLCFVVLLCGAGRLFGTYETLSFPNGIWEVAGLSQWPNYLVYGVAIRQGDLACLSTNYKCCVT